jgi:signal transduction histidine kinase
MEMGSIEEHVVTISHDLKNPLSVIALDVKVVEDCYRDSIPDEVLNVLRRIAANVAFMNRIVHDLLDLSALDGDRLQLHREVVDLAQLLPDTIARCVSPNEQHRVCIDAARDAPVLADIIRIQRVVANLVGNALAYAPTMPIVVRLDSVLRCARVSVIDLGPGLSEQELAELFAKHYRAPSAMGRDGSGLGLYVSRRIIEAHGGTITAASRPRGGSTFSFTLPLYDP